jgi:hypothetical protein
MDIEVGLIMTRASLYSEFDRLARRYPSLMLWVTIAMAIVTTLIVIYNTKDQNIVYKAF